MRVAAVKGLLSECPSFQEFVGAADAAEALAKIWEMESPEPDGTDSRNPPLAVVTVESEQYQRGGWPLVEIGLMLVAPLTEDDEGRPDWNAFVNLTAAAVGELVRDSDPQRAAGHHLVGADLEDRTRATRGDTEQVIVAKYRLKSVPEGE